MCSLKSIVVVKKFLRVESYFLVHTNSEKAETLVSDMNSAYFHLVNHVLLNTKLVVYRIHTVEHMNQAFKNLCIREMKELHNLSKKVRMEN